MYKGLNNKVINSVYKVGDKVVVKCKERVKRNRNKHPNKYLKVKFSSLLVTRLVTAVLTLYQ